MLRMHVMAVKFIWPINSLDDTNKHVRERARVDAADEQRPFFSSWEWMQMVYARGSAGGEILIEFTFANGLVNGKIEVKRRRRYAGSSISYGTALQRNNVEVIRTNWKGVWLFEKLMIFSSLPHGSTDADEERWASEDEEKVDEFPPPAMFSPYSSALVVVVFFCLQQIS